MANGVSALHAPPPPPPPPLALLPPLLKTKLGLLDEGNNGCIELVADEVPLLLDVVAWLGVDGTSGGLLLECSGVRIIAVDVIMLFVFALLAVVLIIFSSALILDSLFN